MNVNDALKSTAARSDKAGARPAAQNPAASGTGSASAAASSDSVQLSSTYQSLETEVSNTGGSFDAKKVAEIKAAIANGTFQVNPEKVASGLIDTVKTLISARHA